MAVDEERWPGPDEYDDDVGQPWIKGMHPIVAAMYTYTRRVAVSGGIVSSLYSAYHSYSYAERFMEEQEKIKEQMKLDYEEAVERKRKELEEKCSPPTKIARKPTHVGPRNGPAFRNGKKQF